MTRVISRSGVELLHGRIAELERQVGELQENFLTLRSVLEAIREAVEPKEEA